MANNRIPPDFVRSSQDHVREPVGVKSDLRPMRFGDNYACLRADNDRAQPRPTPQTKRKIENRQPQPPRVEKSVQPFLTGR